MNSNGSDYEPIPISSEQPTVEETGLDPNNFIGCLLLTIILLTLWAGFATGIAFMALRH